MKTTNRKILWAAVLIFLGIAFGITASYLYFQNILRYQRGIYRYKVGHLVESAQRFQSKETSKWLTYKYIIYLWEEQEILRRMNTCGDEIEEIERQVLEQSIRLAGLSYATGDFARYKQSIEDSIESCGQLKNDCISDPKELKRIVEAQMNEGSRNRK